jgi:hypothetical protein
MKEEIKKPELERPKFFREPYDYRNIENVGEFEGIGERGKVGKDSSSSLDAMPAAPHKMMVPRDHKG